MSLQSIAYRMTGRVPDLDIDLAVTMVTQSWHSIRKLRGWSWQLQQSGFSVPSQITSGTCAVGFGLTTVTGDATASAQWATASQYGSLLTQRQFRIGGGSIYSIIAADFTVPTAAVLTLDRPFIDPLATYTGQPYLIYQPYIATPYKNFIRWLAIRDMTNVRWLNVNADYQERRATDMADPQRQIYTPPLMVLPLQKDIRGQGTATPSSTLGFMLYELYPQPISALLYQTWFEYEGPDVVLPTDTFPNPVSEALVEWRALSDAFANAEGNRDPANPRGSGANFQFLAQFYEAKYKEELKACRINDRESVSLFNATMTRSGSPAPFSQFNPATGVLSVSNLAQRA